ncbi:peptidoglycan-binding protein [Streptomyces sp. NPDC021100]|uniref:peptidoglycan-binding protein n=1 Tax=Streptomyces sp. NPDC021100 TaxID=3365114 RepID=UPI0037ADA11B
MSVAQRVIDVARAEIGYQEGRSGGHWNNKQKYSGQVPGLEWSNFQPYCSTFVSWCFRKAGAAELAPVTASCAEGVRWFQDRDRFTEYPVIGGPVYFGPAGSSHVGICVAYTDSTITTIEANTNVSGSAEGDGVYRKSRPRHSDYVYGYGIPAYPEGVVLAAPEWRRRPGVTFFAHEASAADIPHGSSKPTPAPGYEPFPGAEFFRDEPDSPIVTAMGRRLVAEGCSMYEEGPGPQWSDADRHSYARWQRKLGYSGADADGWPGRASWDALHVPRS